MKSNLIQTTGTRSHTLGYAGSSTTTVSSGHIRQSDQFTVLDKGVTENGFKGWNPIAYTYRKLDGFIGEVNVKRITHYPDGSVFVHQDDTVSGYLGALPNPPQPAFDTEVRNRALSDLNDSARSSVDWSINAFQAKQTAQLLRKLGSVVTFVREFTSGRNFARYVSDWQKQASKNGYKKYNSLPDNRLNARARERAALAVARARRRASYPSTRSDNRYWRELAARDRDLMPVKHTGNVWLEWTYGIKPLVQDVHDTIAEMQKDFPTRFIVEGRASSKDSDKSSGVGPPFWYGTNQTDYSIKHKCRMKVEMVSPVSETQLAAQLTSLNPASMAWEALPWSFVVDWFYNVGGFLRNAETAILYGSVFRRGFESSCVYVEGKESMVGFEDNSTYGGGVSYINTRRFSFSSSRSIYCWKRRSQLYTWPSPSAPRVEVRLGSKRLLNAAALLTTFIKR